MITISLCMIVKDEEKRLARCLDSLSGLMDEIIIVDTGSKDSTKEIASRYTDKIYDYTWRHDFADARNFAFSKATMEYIYSADADELLDEVNRERFFVLKAALLDEVEIVQMKYCNQLELGTTYNFDEEYRPKLFKRLRSFAWIEAIHETVRTEPIVFDSDIEIIHKPDTLHSGRDLQALRRETAKGRRLSKRLHNMYARELIMVGEKEDFLAAGEFFTQSLADETRSQDEQMEALCVLAKAGRLKGDVHAMYKNAIKCVAMGSCAEICYELGEFEFQSGDYGEAAMWYYNAAFESESILDIRCSGELPLLGLAKCNAAAGDEEKRAEYERMANVWHEEHYPRRS